MKAIVSSKVLYEKLEYVTFNPMAKLTIGENFLMFSFNHGAGIYIPVHRDSNETFSVDQTNTKQWEKVRKLARMIPEQPIVIEIDQIDDDKISIELSQFIARF